MSDIELVQHVSVVWLPVGDVDRAVAFYRDTLGLEVKSQDDDWAELDAGGLTIGLNGRESPDGDGGAVVAFQPEDLDGAVEALQEEGIEAERSEHPWGRIAAFRDPDGNALQFYEPPSD